MFKLVCDNPFMFEAYGMNPDDVDAVRTFLQTKLTGVYSIEENSIDVEFRWPQGHTTNRKESIVLKVAIKSETEATMFMLQFG